MATIKSYTDIKQSKVLAEILPLDSADYFYKYCIGHYNSIYYRLEMYSYNKGANKNHDIPCWSLAALLEALPKIHKLKPILDLEENSILYSGTNLDVRADNIIDACVDMVLKLKERSLI